ncbi:hypothetical protein INT47_008330 [Mucor saturninus]|uniref:C-CAP/cofactor C-like domain-containing protein n=1 Tax=Mucor saturninus TaxID=64648 RepID=A0A8H7RE41_9FUNG|nr:hypothetical protein INT47_008330 [Mucor saturninus]
MQLNLKAWDDNSVEMNVTHCGICSSDIHTLDENWRPAKRPCVVSHKIVGVISRVGKNGTNLKVGDRAGVGAQSSSYHECELCLDGQENLCQGGGVFTYNCRWPCGSKSYGGYADKWRGDYHFAFKVPDTMTSEIAATFFCAGVTPYAPLKRANIIPGKSVVGVMGIGGLGHFGVQFAKEFNMTEKTATEASNDFWLEFKNEKQVIQDQLENSRSLPKSQLPTHFNGILQKINTLEKNVTKATEYIPSYDERQCSLQLKELVEKLETTKAELTPKAKFSFKSRKNKTVVAPVTPSVQLALPKEESEILSDATVLLRDKDNCVLTLKDSERKQQSQTSVDILLSNIHHCVVILEQDNVQISAIHIKNVHHCIIYCGSIEGSVLMYGLTDSVLVVGCHQFRMHDAHHVDIMLHVTSRPIIEDSNNIQVGRFHCNDDVNYYDQLEDFNWLKKQASPNWTLMDQDRYSVINKQLSVLKTDKTEDLLLKGLSLLPTE